VVVTVDDVDKLVLLLTDVTVVPLVSDAEYVLLAVVVRTPMHMYWKFEAGTAVSELESPKYTATLDATCTQVNGKPSPV
jgi:hypothetical protein